MKKDQLLTRRGVLIAGAGAVGAAATAGVLTGVTGDGSAGSSVAAAGPQARRPLNSSAYRLQPLTGYAPPRAAPRRTLVRREPLLRLSGRGRILGAELRRRPRTPATPRAILDTLAEYDVRAMFFVCGEMAADHRELLARMADEGHVVGNHTWSHPLLTRLSRRQIHSEMARTSDVIEDAYGERPEWFRAPYGAWNRTAFRLGAELGMEPLAWTVDTLDWTAPGTRVIVDRVEDGAAPGVVVLSHDAGGDRSQSVRALRRYLPELLDSGYHVTVPRRDYA
ncbi:polysaccharide deacetylase family sporulation protein PdaB [Streptomyces viridochromogenes DSM 40736]|uniref:Polysaccharide deacetylase family sporulation protein PdaB n=1 Tax=Streptomyces viridochromogenes (strain DSM 40736 / JCM 4977 / BCRC 1201 / Tue 494) TaxID=591159 RepID=D9XA24_STRVT|nr:polysaccharide deacetylase family protein [Streptomyces viridochromogenes]EFL36414.1 polysaccharide deacetylase family sporulation protein PdaB [Streptomyces viridochromogenes DSM 40736]